MNIHSNIGFFKFAISEILWIWPGPQQSNPIFLQDSLAYNDMQLNEVWLQKYQQFIRYIRMSYFDCMILHCDPDLEDSITIYLEDNLTHDDASPYHVWY